jgi:hypothetical protein
MKKASVKPFVTNLANLEFIPFFPFGAAQKLTSYLRLEESSAARGFGH